TWYNRSNSGLPSNVVNAVALNSNGDLWAATEMGIARFDGSTWQTYRTDNSPLPEASVTDVAVGPNNEVWMQCGIGVMFTKFQSGSWSNVDCGAYGAKCLAVASNGDLYAGTPSNGLLKYDGNIWTNFSTGNSNLANNFIPRIAIGPGDLVFLRNSTELATFNGSTFTAYPIPVHPDYSSALDHLHVAADGSCYVTTSAVYITDPEPDVLYPRCLRLIAGVWNDLHHFGYPTPPQGPMGTITLDGTGVIWTGADRFFSRTGTTWAQEPYATSAPGQTLCSSVHAADNEVVWAAGVYAATNNRYNFDGTTWSEYNSGQLITVNDVITDGAGNPILATPGGVLWANGNSWTVFNSVNSPIPSDYIDELFMDTSGALWVIPDNGGILKYDGAWTLYTTANTTLSSNDVTSIAQHSDGMFWIGTGNGAAGGGGVSRFDGSTWTTWTPLSSNLPYNIFVRDISIASDGKPWMLLDRSGETDVVAHFDGTDFILYDNINSALPMYLSCLMIGPDNVPLVGTPFNGLEYLSPVLGQWNTFDITNSGIASNGVNDIDRAPNGDIWLSTGSGLNKLTVDFIDAVDEAASPDTHLTLAPSIADDQVQVMTNSILIENAILEVIDARGRVAHRESIRLAPGSPGRTIIGTHQLAPGMYTMALRGSTLRSARFIVAH
ncbi:MAG TPA: two-component regulator propeller domain-containing protein, partial [Flavobacteriales bacterium]|nr:two-component regulator propeller domain-containing protein [Flavobacteriales bacterium]